MAIRFSAAKGGTCPVIVRALCPSVPLGAVNDNGTRRRTRRQRTEGHATAQQQDAATLAANERIFAEALRHFARHGLSAASHARANAAAARLAGDIAACDWWIAICRQLDHRMAEAFARRLTTNA
ncbi:hypothetical protein [Novosphingobium sp. ST904]|uniref:hypothetical protein n=1 Tax=Novosphingobium sp. ST904 TaxID=1684385 RepID=UPI0006C88789|nr:hypothetical protein [Novosphingobium sp. ST904]KPH66420.1 hypothetical protein ADT71_06315 [Novosphingobium sp. ST904]TCM34474.1 hypothetical protein EDF59_11733 [Novosphingobium sp. ST904]